MSDEQISSLGGSILSIIQSRVVAFRQDPIGPTRCAFPKALAVPRSKLRKYKEQLEQTMLRLRHSRISDNANLHCKMVQEVNAFQTHHRVHK